MTTKNLLLAGLTVSVLINLALIGLYTGHFVTGGPGAPRLDPMLGIRHLVGDLPEDRRIQLEPYFKDYFRTLRPRFRNIRSTQSDLREAMLTEPLDTAAVAKALNEFNVQLFETQSMGNEAFVRLAAVLTLEERQRFLDHLKRPPEHRRRPPG